jgi:hypothetical protein
MSGLAGQVVLARDRYLLVHWSSLDNDLWVPADAVK